MSFMKAQMTEKCEWYAVDGDAGTDMMPVDMVGSWEMVGEYTENRRVDSIEVVTGYGVRSSAPGYMDCTPWEVYTTKREAMKAYNQHKRENNGEDY